MHLIRLSLIAASHLPKKSQQKQHWKVVVTCAQQRLLEKKNHDFIQKQRYIFICETCRKYLLIRDKTHIQLETSTLNEKYLTKTNTTLKFSMYNFFSFFGWYLLSITVLEILSSWSYNAPLHHIIRMCYVRAKSIHQHGFFPYNVIFFFFLYLCILFFSFVHTYCQ